MKKEDYRQTLIPLSVLTIRPRASLQGDYRRFNLQAGGRIRPRLRGVFKDHLQRVLQSPKHFFERALSDHFRKYLRRSNKLQRQRRGRHAELQLNSSSKSGENMLSALWRGWTYDQASTWNLDIIRSESALASSSGFRFTEYRAC